MVDRIVRLFKKVIDHRGNYFPKILKIIESNVTLQTISAHSGIDSFHCLRRKSVYTDIL